MPRPRFQVAHLGALAAVLVLAGCATSGVPELKPVTPVPPLGPGPSAPVHAPPVTPAAPAAPAAPVATVKPASIAGSEETSTMFDNFTAYVAKIDGQPVGDRDGWRRPHALTPGPHELTIAFVRGVFFARTDVRITARSGARYTVKFDSDAHVFGKNSYCEFWIEDTLTGEKVLTATRVPLSRAEQGAQK
jgi:hypothetical protein